VKIGLGGGAGRFRAGVSTRGVGAGCGPLSAGSGLGGGGIAAWLSLIIPALIVSVLVLWPYLLGKWLAVKFGADPRYSVDDIVGWVFEAVYLILILVVVLSNFLAARSQAREAVLKQAADDAASELAARTRASEVIRRVGERFVLAPFGEQNDVVPSKEKLLGEFDHVALIEPRATGRDGGRARKAVDNGVAVVSDRAVRFQGQTKSVEWRFDRMLDLYQEDEVTTFSVTNRQLVSGIAVEQQSAEIFALVLDWGRRLSMKQDVAVVGESLKKLREGATVMDAGVAPANPVALSDPPEQPQSCVEEQPEAVPLDPQSRPPTLRATARPAAVGIEPHHDPSVDPPQVVREDTEATSKVEQMLTGLAELHNSGLLSGKDLLAKKQQVFGSSYMRWSAAVVGGRVVVGPDLLELTWHGAFSSRNQKTASPHTIRPTEIHSLQGVMPGKLRYGWVRFGPEPLTEVKPRPPKDLYSIVVSKQDPDWRALLLIVEYVSTMRFLNNPFAQLQSPKADAPSATSQSVSPLKMLSDEGILTAAEYEEKRQESLGQP